MIYFDNAATTFPKPNEVIRGMLECMKRYGGNPGRGAHQLAVSAAEAVYDARSEVASFFGSSKPENVIFTQNATHALNTAIFGTVKQGDHILISNLEHNSVLRPVAELYRQGTASYSVFDALKSDEETLENIKKALRINTRVIITTHASNVCPRLLPIEDIAKLCRHRGICYIVDASQSAGIYDISMKCGISILCAPGHKGLYGPQGSGFCLFADDLDLSRFKPLMYGGNGYDSANTDMGNISPESFESGTVAVPNIVGLRYGIRYIKKIGIDKIALHEQTVSDRIFARLKNNKKIELYLPQKRQGSVISFNAEGISGTNLSALLADHGICTRAGLHCSPLAHRALGTGNDAVRLSFSAFNTIYEADEFCRILESSLRL